MQSLVNMDLPDFCIVPILLPAQTKHLQFHSVTLNLEKKNCIFMRFDMLINQENLTHLLLNLMLSSQVFVLVYYEAYTFSWKWIIGESDT